MWSLFEKLVTHEGGEPFQVSQNFKDPKSSNYSAQLKPELIFIKLLKVKFWTLCKNTSFLPENLKLFNYLT